MRSSSYLCSNENKYTYVYTFKESNIIQYINWLYIKQVKKCRVKLMVGYRRSRMMPEEMICGFMFSTVFPKA